MFPKDLSPVMDAFIQSPEGTFYNNAPERKLQGLKYINGVHDLRRTGVCHPVFRKLPTVAVMPLSRK